MLLSHLINRSLRVLLQRALKYSTSSLKNTMNHHQTPQIQKTKKANKINTKGKINPILWQVMISYLTLISSKNKIKQCKIGYHNFFCRNQFLMTKKPNVNNWLRSMKYILFQQTPRLQQMMIRLKSLIAKQPCNFQISSAKCICKCNQNKYYLRKNKRIKQKNK